MQQETSHEARFDDILRGNLARVFNERNATRRLAAMADFWAEDAVMFEADGVFVGRKAISDKVGDVQARLSANMSFAPTAATIVNRGTALLRWQAADEHGEAAVTGTDIAVFKERHIHSMRVYLDPH